MKKIKLLFILVLVLSFCFLAACETSNPGGNQGGNQGGDTPAEPEIDWDSKTIKKISAVNETFYASYEYDEFELSFLKINVFYTDGTSRVISVDETMLDENDLKKLKSTGQPKITIYYGEEELQMKVKLIDSSRLDENLNPDGKYACVIKALRNKDTGIINFYIDPNVEYDIVAVNFAFSFDSSVMQLSNAQINSNLEGIGQVKIEDGKLVFAYSENATSFEDEVVLFSVNYEGDYRNSGLALLESYNNVVYAADLTTYQTTPVTNVLYHVSVK